LVESGTNLPEYGIALGAAVSNSQIEPDQRRRGPVVGRGPEPSVCICVHLWFHLFLACIETVGA
jgi:hypothetical protein